MDRNRFDDLTRVLAQGTSRRQALKLLGGGLLAALVPGSVLAKGGGNSNCAKFCATTFGADTPAAGKCTSDAAHGKGLCYTCGPASSGGTKGICCSTNPNGTCTSYSSATCCSGSATCQNGTCVNPIQCPATDTLGFALGVSDTTTDPIFCSYPAVSGEDPYDFFCRYSKTTGALVQDNDAGLCPGSAASSSARSSQAHAVIRTGSPTKPARP